MYSNLIEEIIRSHTDKNKFNTGFSFFKRNLVINDYSKVDGDNITFYATVIDENHRNNYTAIISINTKTRVISNMSCDCHSLLSNTKPQICDVGRLPSTPARSRSGLMVLFQMSSLNSPSSAFASA